MIMGRPVGMGPVHYQKHKINKCEQFHKLTCDPDIDKCCAVVRCEYCLSFDDAYGDNAVGTASTEDGITWTGTVGNLDVELTLFRDYSTGECYLQVIADGEIWDEIPLCSKVDYDTSMACSDLSNESIVQGGLLKWFALKTIRLPYVTGEDGCKTYFCGDCECAPRELCVAYEDQISGPDSVGVLTKVGTECDPPTWSGTTSDGTITNEITITLVRDPYGNCRLEGYLGYTDVLSEPITDCKTMEAQFFLGNGIRMGVRSKTCETCVNVPSPPCCDGTLPETLNAQVSFGNCPAGPCTVDVPLSRRVLKPPSLPLNLATIGWYGVAASNCGNMQIVVACVFESGQYVLYLYSDQCTGAPIANWPTGFGQVAATYSCSPFFMSGTSTPSASCCPGQTTLTTFSVSL